MFAEEGRPRDLTTVRVVGIGDFADRGFSQLGLPGLMRRTIGSNIGNEPRLGAGRGRGARVVPVPQGVLSQLMREIDRRATGPITQVGLGTYVDPRQTGGKQNARTRLVELVTLRGREWRQFDAFLIDVAVIRDDRRRGRQPDACDRAFGGVRDKSVVQRLAPTLLKIIPLLCARQCSRTIS